MPKRRTKGDGGITRRHDHRDCPPLNPDGTRPDHHCRGRWQGTVPISNPDTGRKTKRYIYGKTSKEVAQKIKATIRERDAGTLVLDAVTVERWMNTWLDRKARTLKPQTMRSHREKARNYIVPALGSIKLPALRANRIEALYDNMRDQGKAEATVRQVHAVLSGALKDAVRKGMLSINPIDRVEPPGTHKNRREQFTIDQARQVLTAAGDDARWWAALFYGMRQGEVLGLDWQWIDFTRHRMKIDLTLQADEHGHLFLGEPKTKRSKRWLPLVPMMEARLRLLWELEGRPTEGLVFHHNGQPIQPKRDWQDWRDLIDRATVIPYTPLPYIALHAARNSAASLMEAAGIPDRLVMQILGQSQVATTHSYQEADVERMGQALGGAGDLLALE